ncbi:MAG TPA: ATP-binding protein [Desulfomonilaceae bacterium]|nr:ATP-binding protein [Desulfomonilaceae bacterium]
MTSTLPLYPFAAIVGQDKLKLALILNIVDPTIGGVLIRGEKGTAKSTAVRGLADILPMIEVVENCPFQLPARDTHVVCANCMDQFCLNGNPAIQPASKASKISVVELPLGATEDRLVGTLNLEHALKTGEKRFEPGILGQAHRNILYVDEVNLLDDHLVDVLLDSAAMGMNTVEREGVSFAHPARFTLVGTMNPEEGELRPQLLDRFGLCVNIEGIRDARSRVEIMERRLGFDRDPWRFAEEWSNESAALSRSIQKAQMLCPDVATEKAILQRIAHACLKLGVDGHRADIATLKTTKALAAYEGRINITPEDVAAAAELALPHRMRRAAFDGAAGEVIEEIRRTLQSCSPDVE